MQIGDFVWVNLEGRTVPGQLWFPVDARRPSDRARRLIAFDGSRPQSHAQPMIEPPSDTVTISLSTGERVTLRPIRPDDASRLQALTQRLSPESRYRRFFSHRQTLPAAEAAHFAQVDAHTRLAIVAERPTPAGLDLIGIAHCDVISADAPHTATMAILVEDAFQHTGLGRALLQHLIVAARAQGITRFEGEVLTENQPMLAFLRDAGFPVTLTEHGGEILFTGEIGLDLASGETDA
jgi:GNAT superfamily N-acetyltransferase